MDKDTVDRILDTAERLFAENGISSVSVRQIISEARVNIASVNYHFGSKHGLIIEVFRRRLLSLNYKRLRLLDELLERSSPASVKDLLRAFFTPALEHLNPSVAGGLNFVKLMARAHTESDPKLKKEVFSQFREVVERFTAELCRSLPDLPEKEVKMRFFFAIGCMVNTMFHAKEADIGGEKSFLPKVDERVLEDLVEFCARGFSGSSKEKG